MKAHMRRRKVSFSIEQSVVQIEAGEAIFSKFGLLIDQHSFQKHKLAQMVGIVVCHQYGLP
jgi:hypothetical protein